MTRRRPCPAAPGPLAGMRPGLMTCSAHWRSGGDSGVPGRRLAPRDRNKTLTALAGAEPVTGAQHPAVQRALISRLNGNCGRARLRVLGYHTYHHAWDATTIPSDPSGCRRARLRLP